MKAVLKWLGENWIWSILLTLMLAGVTGLGYKIFSTYAATFPYISNDHTAWASFGSLLAGFFTLTGTVATVATLLFLARQNKAMQKVTQAQLDTLTFERYINHRKLFFDQLDSLVTAHKNTFRFRDPSHLYSALFPENSPHHCAFKVEAAYYNGEPSNRVADIYYWLESIRLFLKKDNFSDVQSNLFLHELIQLQDDLLMYESTCEVRDGDLSCMDKHYGINIYTLEDFLVPALHIANVLLKFVGNEEIHVNQFDYKSDVIRKGLIVNSVSVNTIFPVKVRRTINGVPILFYVYSVVLDFRKGYEYILPDVVRLLRDTFDSADSVNKLSDGLEFDKLVQKCLSYVHQVEEGLGPQHLQQYNSIHDSLLRLMRRSDMAC